MTKPIPITLAYGDGIGPEITKATLAVLSAANAPIAPEVINIGEKVYLSGNAVGIPKQAWQSLCRTKVLLKGPVMTPQGQGYKSINVTIRKTLGLYANVRPCRAFTPVVPSHFPAMDLVVIRENEEDLYAGIEHRQTADVHQALKLISHCGTQRIIRFAFEYARKFNRKKITCMIKDNIMKITDGLFHQVFKAVAKEYPDINADSMIIDIGMAKVATCPEKFDVIVTENLYGDILSDVTAQIAGSVGLAGSANIGKDIAMFEAIHGCAPDIAGQNIANPSGMLNAAVMMLVHLGQGDKAALIKNAWLKTLEDGIHTADIFTSSHSKTKVGTEGFAKAVMARLGQKSSHFGMASYGNDGYNLAHLAAYETPPAALIDKKLVGCDVFIDLAICKPNEVAKRLLTAKGVLQLQIITNRGIRVWPLGHEETHCSDHWRCRFVAGQNYPEISFHEVLHLLNQLVACGLEVIKMENLYTFDGKLGFSLA